MSKTDLSYEDWIDYVFGHAVPFSEQAWYFNADEDWWDPEPAQAVAYMTQLFETPEPLAEQFADSQIGQGLYYLVDNGAGAYCRFLTDATVPIEARLACVEAMSSLFARLFQPRCEPVLSHLDEPGDNELNRICYMWWDIMPIGAVKESSGSDPIQDGCLSEMEDILRLPNPACQESALHGLGHWAHAYPEFTETTINAYLAANPTLRPELVRYAHAARAGCVQ
ncbi:hypothetical protein [Dongia deserti]|uniref:hypothetical protein n=1 Tax=Dongia deserti TaxID=2268030 RepID=UPI000E6508D9|nr:hypothetical protein [Dongia deserti]